MFLDSLMFSDACYAASALAMQKALYQIPQKDAQLFARDCAQVQS